MSQPESQHKRKGNSPFEVPFWAFIFSFIASEVLRYLGWLPAVPGLAVAYAVAMLVEYWIPPKPPVSFPLWVARVVSYLFPVLLGMWLIPVLLLHWVWTPLAYGIPTFIVLLFLQWMLTLDPIKRQRREALWKSLLLALGFSIFYAWYASWAMDGFVRFKE